MELEKYKKHIGREVSKQNCKPFENGKLIAKIKDVVLHPQSGSVSYLVTGNLQPIHITKCRLKKILQKNEVELVDMGLYKRGMYIRKNNFGLFNGNPVLKIKTVNLTSKKYLRVNDLIFSDNYPVLLTEQEAIELRDEWDNFNFEPVLGEPQPFQHVREDNGQEKVAIAPERVKWLLWSYRKRVNKDMDAYICPECNEIHIGKPRNINL